MFIYMKYIVVPAVLLMVVYFTGCSGSSRTEESDIPDETHEEETVIKSPESSVIFSTAKLEQENIMYSPEVDSTYLYWTNNELVILNGSTKCNIFALNVLFRSGYKTPESNALAADLYDTSKLKDIMLVIGINDFSKAEKGDLIVWNYHVIIFESILNINDENYALAWWAGTRQPDNDDNIKNNVCFGKYKLGGDYIVRRPLKK